MHVFEEPRMNISTFDLGTQRNKININLKIEFWSERSVTISRNMTS